MFEARELNFPEGTPGRATTLAPLAVLVIVTLVCLGRLCGYGYSSWDDVFNIAYNPRLTPPSWRALAHYWTHAEFKLYMPMTYTAWSALAAIAYTPRTDALGSHLNPSIFHIANLIVHVFSAILVYQILALILQRPWAACAGTFLFAIHPVQVEAVGWIAGLKDLLAGFFSFAGLWLYLRAVIGPTRSSWATAASYALGTVALVLAMLSKPSAVVVPAIALVIDRMLFDRPLRKSILWLAPWIVLAIGCAIVAHLAQPAEIAPHVPWKYRGFIAGDALAFYLKKLLLPVNLGIDYGRTPDLVLSHWWGRYAWVVPAAVLLLAAVLRKRAPAPLLAAAIFALAIAPNSGIIPFGFQYVSTVADHYLYIAMLGPALLVAWCFSRVQGRGAWITGSAIGAMFFLMSFFQAAYWRDGFALFTHAVEVNPKSIHALNNLATILVAPDSGHSPEEALAFSRRAYELARALGHPDPSVLDTHGFALVRTGAVDDGILLLRQSLTLQPSPETHYHLAEGYLRRAMPRQARAQLAAASATIDAMLAQDLPVDPRLRSRIESALERAGRD